MKKGIKIGLLVVWMAVIFYLSCEPKNETIATTNTVVEALYSIYKLLISKNPLNIADFSELIFKPVRKLAHFSEFAILGVLMYSVYNDKQKDKNMLWPLILSALYAISDEIHQYFVPGRACTLIDILIDTCGAFIGILFIHLVIKRWKRKQ